jgi:hypothetical protein
METGLKVEPSASHRVGDCRCYQPADEEERTWQAERDGLLSADRAEGQADHGRCSQDDACADTPCCSSGTRPGWPVVFGTPRPAIHGIISA